MEDDDEDKAADDSMEGTEEVGGDDGNVDNVGDSGCVGRHTGFVSH